MFGILGQHRLYSVSWDYLDQRVETGSIFPLFDQAGETRKIMLTTSESGEILVIDYRPDLFKRRFFGPHQIDLKRADHRDLRSEDMSGSTNLWHFDPCWKLREERFRLHPAAPDLRSTNILGFEKPFDRIWFTSNLGRACLVTIGSGEEAKIKRFSPSLLEKARRQRLQAVREPAAASRPDRTTWRLRPFWEAQRLTKR